MFKRILPIYQTGWFYLILIFLTASFWFVSIGGLNQLNQLNINFLSYLSPIEAPSLNKSALKSSDFITLQSSFNEGEITAISTVLTNNPKSKVILLGEQSNIFLAQLDAYLALHARENKVVISSLNTSSEQPLALQSTMTLTQLLNWFRFSPDLALQQFSSDHFIYAPFLINQRQSFPILWQQQGETYLSAVGQLLKQLSANSELSLKQRWQLSLTNELNTIMPQSLALGFLGEVFTSGEAYTGTRGNNNQVILANEKTPLKSVNLFALQQYNQGIDSTPSEQYSVIIITDNQRPIHNIIKPLLSKLVNQDYLSQNISTLLLCWILAIIGLLLTWFIRNRPNKQLICISCYSLALFIIQYFMFKQTQWLEVLPAILLILGFWLLVLAYQKEYNLFLVALHHQTPPFKTSSAQMSALPTNTKNATPNQALSASTKNSNKVTSTSKAQLQPKTKVASAQENDLEQTLVIIDQPVQSQASINHHLTVNNFGRYQVEGILGKGAMGIVYQGVDPKINRHVAIKTLQLSDDINSPEFSEAKDRFFREAQTAGGLSHANIVTIYDVGEENNLGYIAMDLLTGAPLSLFTQPGQTLPTPLVYQLLIQITDALDYAHKQNVVHRDIKPANIIYDDDLLKVTVTDFGIAYVSDNSKTRTGIIMGSPYYMSPEQILGLKVDGRSDIFSLGVTFYQLLCGHLPFEGESIATVAYQITKAKAINVTQRNADIPASALRITNKAMHKDIEKRYQTMDEFKLALINALKRDFKIS